MAQQNDSDENHAMRFDKRKEKGAAVAKLCWRAPLVLAPHTIMCTGLESFTEETRRSAACGPYISSKDVTCVKSLWSFYMG